MDKKFAVAVVCLALCQLALIALGAWLIAASNTTLSMGCGVFIFVANGALISTWSGPLLTKIISASQTPPVAP